MLNFQQKNHPVSKFITSIMDILNRTGMSHVWQSQGFPNHEWLKKSLQRRLADHAMQKWTNDLIESSKCTTYCMFKKSLKYEPYLNILPLRLSKIFIKFRVSNHKLPIERLRYTNVTHENRKCPLCDTGNIGDEFHYLFICPKLTLQSEKLLPLPYTTYPNGFKMELLLNSTDKSVLTNLCHFLYLVMQLFK